MKFQYFLWKFIIANHNWYWYIYFSYPKFDKGPNCYKIGSYLGAKSVMLIFAFVTIAHYELSQWWVLQKSAADRN